MNSQLVLEPKIITDSIMAIPNSLPTSGIPSDNSFFQYDQSVDKPVTLFNGRNVMVRTPNCHRGSTKSGCPLKQASQRCEGHLGKFTDLLFRFVDGNINSSDYCQLHLLKLMTFKDILNHIDPTSPVLDKLSDELLQQVFTRQHSDFSEIPESQLTQEFCHRACQINPSVIEYVPLRFKTTAMCHEACCRKIEMLRFVPEHIMSESFLHQPLNNCYGRYFNPGLIPDHLLTDAIRKKICFSPLIRKTYPLSLIPAGKRDYHCYLQACKMSSNAIKSVPEALLTEEICLAALNHHHQALADIPVARRTAALCELAVTQSIESLKWLPEHLITARHRDILIAQSAEQPNNLCSVFQYIPESLRTPEFNQALLDSVLYDGSFNALLEFSPAYLRTITANLLQRLKAASIDNDHLVPLLRVAFQAEHCPDRRQLIQFIKNIMHFRAVDMKLSQVELCDWLAASELNKSFKLSLLKLVNHPAQHLVLKTETASSLTNLSSPLNFQVQSNTLPELKQVCQRSLLSKMPEHDQGDLLDQFINHELANLSLLTDVRPPDFTAQNTFCHGRTLIMPGDQHTRYFKLHRMDEDLNQLAKEFLIHRYLSAGKAAELNLKSEIPQANYLCALPWLAIPEELRLQLEPIKLFNQNSASNGSSYAIAYCYQTSSTDYASYAWQQDPGTPDAPYAKAISGMLRAVHDLGRWCAMGILHTSTLPAYHDQYRGRRWTALNSLFLQNQSMLCGRLDFADGEAIEHADFRFSGLADLADYERFGCVKSYFTNNAIDSELHFFPKAGQNFCLANYIVEIMVANVLLHARLHQDHPDYHIDSATALDSTGEFISQLMTQFLQGLLGQNHPSVVQFLCISMADFRVWKRRTSVEVVYWSNDKMDTRNHAVDYQKDHRFDPGLYPFAPILIDGVQDKQYPQEFSNRDGQPTVGVENGTFPFMSLIQGLTKFAATIIHTLNQRELHENSDQTHTRSTTMAMP